MEEVKNNSKFNRMKDWLKGPIFLMYLNYFSETWGSRMWNFALGMFFVVLADKALLLSAIYGFLTGGCVLLFGGILGQWVDRTNRLTAIRRAILVQKLSVFFCASLICVVLFHNKAISSVWGGALGVILQGVVLILAVIAELATISYSYIQLQKDWFVVSTLGSKDKLANLNAGARVVDLVTNILTPIITGQIMTSMSQIVAGVTIAIWHIVAIAVEICLLTRIYKMLPEMAVKNNERSEEMTKLDTEYKINGKNNNAILPPENDELLAHEKEKEECNSHTISAPNTETKGLLCHQRALHTIRGFISGWQVYGRQVILFAGLSLGFLFMTVLGFDSVTVGYIYSNNVPPNVLGLIMAMGSVAGVIGAFLYTQFRKYFGLERTGMLSMTWQLTCLVVCVISLFLPGSRFQPDALWNGIAPLNSTTTSFCKNITATNSSSLHLFDMQKNISIDISSRYYTELNITALTRNGINCGDEMESSIISPSIVVFLTGLCLSRLGLYLTDLVITQIMQENVAEQERGIVNGTQWSLNKLMAMLKFILVLIIPQIETFGYLIILTFIFISIAFGLYLFHCFKISGLSLKRCLAGQTPSDESDGINSNKIL